jgi:hypothetical protein
LWDWLPYVSSINIYKDLLSTLLIVSGRAELAYCLDCTHLENRFVTRAASPADDYFVPDVLGESLDGKAVGLEIGKLVQAPIIDQNVSPFLLVHTAGHRRRLLALLLPGG